MNMVKTTLHMYMLCKQSVIENKPHPAWRYKSSPSHLLHLDLELNSLMQHSPCPAVQSSSILFTVAQPYSFSLSQH